MSINYYRTYNSQGEDESWQACQFTADTDLTQLTVKPLVTINGRHVLQQHHVTYLTGKETCHAHHFAKSLAIKVLSQPKGGSVLGDAIADKKPAPACKLLWIDSLHGPHVCAKIYHELAAHAQSKEDLHFVCLDVLGSQRENVWALTRNIEALIKMFKPELVVIDDIDHLMPFCGTNIANEFCSIVKDVINHTETAFLFIGYNHLNKKASTTGYLGKYLFTNATDIFALSTQHDITTVRLVSSYNMSCQSNGFEYRFTIGPDNLPHEIHRLPKPKTINDEILQDIVNDILVPGETFTPDELLQQVSNRQRQLRQQDRSDSLLAQALELNLIKKVEGEKNGQCSGQYTLNTRDIDSTINNSLTIPPHPNHPTALSSITGGSPYKKPQS